MTMNAKISKEHIHKYSAEPSISISSSVFTFPPGKVNDEKHKFKEIYKETRINTYNFMFILLAKKEKR